MQFLHFRFVDLILREGAHVDVKNKKGNSPLWLAANGTYMYVQYVMYMYMYVYMCIYTMTLYMCVYMYMCFIRAISLSLYLFVALSLSDLPSSLSLCRWSSGCGETTGRSRLRPRQSGQPQGLMSDGRLQEGKHHDIIITSSSHCHYITSSVYHMMCFCDTGTFQGGEVFGGSC